jgi:uncharacterized membrane protein YbaN (DUF454 family)
MELSPPLMKSRSKLVRGVFFLLGSLSLIGVAFSFLPGIPTGDLVVLSLFFYSRSSPRFEAWLRSRPFVQRVLKRYEGGLTRTTKIQATIGIVLSLALSAGFLTSNRTLRTVLAVVGLYALWFVWSRPAKLSD